MKRSIHSVSPCQRLMLNIVIAMSAGIESCVVLVVHIVVLPLLYSI